MRGNHQYRRRRQQFLKPHFSLRHEVSVPRAAPFIHQKNLWLDGRRHREGQADGHAGGIPMDGHIQKLTQS